MPPKPKFSRAEMIEAALIIVRQEGLEALTSRDIGAQLGTSSRPIFTEFINMDEVKKEVLQAAKDLYNRYAAKMFSDNGSFKELALQYFTFAKEEPQLFETLFMRNVSTAELSDILPSTHHNYKAILSFLQKNYGLSRSDAIKIFETMWLFTHGITCLQVTKGVQFTDDELRERLDDVFWGVLNRMKDTTT